MPYVHAPDAKRHKLAASVRQKALTKEHILFRVIGVRFPQFVMKSMKILVVDDDPMIRELLKEILVAHDYDNVKFAEDGAQALKIISNEQTPFDCFMFDIQMPNMDGIELCRRTRAFTTNTETPVIMITAMNERDYIDRAFAAGATDYVTKPFDVTELMSRVRLADRLQAETRLRQEVLANNVAMNKLRYSDPVVVKDVNGFVSQTVLENFTKTSLQNRSFPMAAFGVKVRELEVIHAGARPDEYKYVIADIAQVIAETLVGTQAFMSYVGSGRFVCVCDRSRLIGEDELLSELQAVVNDDEYVWCEDVETTYSIILGPRETPGMLERGEDLRFVERAIEELDVVAAGGTSSRQSKSISSKLMSVFAA